MDDRRFMCGKYLYLNKDWSLGFHVGRNNADDLAGWIVDHVQDEDLKEWFFSGLFGEGLFFDDCNTAEFTYLGDLLIQAAQHVDGAAVIRDKIIQAVKKESRWRPEILPLLYKTKWAEWRKTQKLSRFVKISKKINQISESLCLKKASDFMHWYSTTTIIIDQNRTEAFIGKKYASDLINWLVENIPFKEFVDDLIAFYYSGYICLNYYEDFEFTYIVDLMIKGLEEIKEPSPFKEEAIQKMTADPRWQPEKMQAFIQKVKAEYE